MAWFQRYSRQGQEAKTTKGVVDTAAVKAKVELLIIEIRAKLDDIERALGEAESGTIEANVAERAGPHHH